MTYRELIEFCRIAPEEECYNGNCSCRKECDVFRDAVGEYPSLMYNALGVDFNTEIEVKE